MKPFRNLISMLFFLGLALLLSPYGATAQEYPNGITPNETYVSATQLLGILDVLLQAKELEAPLMPEISETALGPLHVYQMALAVAGRLQEFAAQVGIQQLPTFASSPRPLAPRDVQLVLELMLDNLRQAARVLGVEDRLPTAVPTATGKVPTDVFRVLVESHVKLDRLCGHDKISPNEVYAQMVRATMDVRSILQQGDPASRYRIDAPPSDYDRSPRHVVERALEIRGTINQLRERLGLPVIALPGSIPDGEIDPIYPFVQAEIIIADLNLLKIHLKTVSSTPLPVPVRGKNPTHVHQEALLLQHLLQQVPQILASAFSGKSE
jgi:hypothetical protein